MNREQLRALRQRLGISQARLCADLGLNRTGFVLWENGHGKLRAELLDAVAMYLALELRAVKEMTAPTRTGAAHG